MKKRKNVQFIAAAALTAALVTSQFSFATVMGDNTATVQVSSLIPNNVTIDQPIPLSDISLPKSDYGTLSWADGSCVPSARVQTYDVVFRPYNTADLAKISGWDGQSDAIYSSVTVVVSSISKDSDYEGTQIEQEYTDTENTEQNTENVKDNTTDNAEENTEAADSEVTPEVTEVPGNVDNTANSEPAEDKNTTDTDSTEVTETPENTDDTTAENTETPAVTETPATTEAPAENNENPEVTEIPVEDKDTPDAVDTPAATEDSEVTETPEVTEIPEATVTPEADKDNIFDGTEKDITADDRAQLVEETAEPSDEEKAQLAEENHTCNGISVSGINLPWYVQFRVASGENYEFTNEAEANVFKSYEFELWDLKNNTEYEIPDGEYLSVTVPVKAGYDYTIEHLLDSGAMETIVPSVEGSTMVFSTHSFSPFGIAGSKALVGEEIEDGSYSSGTTTSSTTTTTTPQAAATTAASSSTGNTVNNTTNNSNSTTSGSTNTTSVQSGTSDNQNSASDSTDQSEADNKSNSVGAVETGDNTPILPFVIIGIAAAVIVAVLVYLKKKK